MLRLRRITTAPAPARLDLPRGWEDASAVTTRQTAAGGGAATSPAWSAVGMEVRIYGLRPRCGQAMCGWLTGSRLLVQPCVMDPISVARCDCPQDIFVASPMTVSEVWHRGDRYASESDPTPHPLPRGGR